MPALARVAGGLAVLAALCGVLAPMFPMVTERTPSGGTGGDFGSAANLFDFVPPLAAAAVLGTAGVLVLRGRLPRFGLAAIGVFGAGSIGVLMQTIYLYDTANRSSRDLPLPVGMVRSFRYDPATGLHLKLLAGILAVAALVTVALAWSRTWVEDDGGFDLLRPLFGGFALLPGFLAMAGVCLAAGVSDVALNGPQSIVRRDGVDMVGTIVLALVLLGGAVIAPSIRPRQATVGVFAGLAAFTGAETLRSGLLVARADTLSLGLSGIVMVLATCFFVALAVTAWYMSRLPDPDDDDR